LCFSWSSSYLTGDVKIKNYRRIDHVFDLYHYWCIVEMEAGRRLEKLVRVKKPV
jgi:4-alpha-glucanotransferase